nr:MAG TPA: hypothetical protein [Caudoviricetes sp.]
MFKIGNPRYLFFTLGKQIDEIWCIIKYTDFQFV